MKISLVVTVYNKKPFLRRCLDSVARQTEKDFQTIIVDDGSTDGSKEICEDYAGKRGWELYRNEGNRGVSVARNLGMDKANGEYIAFLDADDALTDDAIDIMTKITRHGYNIVQFGQYRCHPTYKRQDSFRKGWYDINGLPKRWAMVWNKIYNTAFIRNYSFRFIEGMQFGEDEVFNARCMLKNGGVYHAPQTLILHYFDDKKSLCRGELSVERLQGLIRELTKIAEESEDVAVRLWAYNKIEVHKNSALFKRFRYREQSNGKYDIVYFLKNTPVNEELRYSLRSVEENWQYHKVWFYGGCPDGITPDYKMRLPQKELSKWERVRGLLYKACQNDDITEDFWLFNDDFFVLKLHTEDMPPQYNKTLQERIRKIESRHGNQQTEYTTRLRHLVKTLEGAGKGFLDYTVHKPMLINRKKMLEVLDKFPDEPMSRALYGNYWEIGGVSNHDMKIQKINWAKTDQAFREWGFVSTQDESFAQGKIGRYIRNRFDKPSRFEL